MTAKDPTPFADWCQHYDYDPAAPDATADYQRYLSGLALSGQVVKEAERRDSTDEQIKRAHTIKFRVTADELAQIRRQCTKPQLAEWVREVALYGQRDMLAPAAVAHADPALLRALAGIGNNLNQIARAVNGGAWGPADTVAIVAALRDIERRLDALRPAP